MDSNRSYIVNTDGNVYESLKGDIYDADVSESDIAPTEIFEYEIISNADTGSTSLDSLPTKEARIIRIKPEYCNNISGGYISENGEHYDNTNYEIILEDGTKITDTLIIPYQVEIDGEMYKITEANITAAGIISQGELELFMFPKVKTIIFPNTIEKISAAQFGRTPQNDNISKIILPQKLKIISDNTFCGCESVTSIEIPSSVTSIGNRAFYLCRNLINVKIPSGVTNLGDEIFWVCDSLTSIDIPNTVTSIGEDAFYSCYDLTTVNYTGTMEEWKQINIHSSNTYYLNRAQIICTDGTINQ